VPARRKETTPGRVQKHPRLAKLYIKAAQRFLDTHPSSKINGYFNDAFEWFVFTLYCDSLEEFRSRFGADMFGQRVDCKQHLEQMLGIIL
jgi:hypothetical protein